MNYKKKLVRILVHSLINDSENWVFDDSSASHNVSKIRIWFSEKPIVNVEIRRPITVKFNLWHKYLIFKALNQCRIKIVINQTKTENQ